jgi:2-iminoacetate synthase
MSFLDLCRKYDNFSFDSAFAAINTSDVFDSLTLTKNSAGRLIALLSPEAEDHFELLAEKAQALSLNNFGKALLLYTPLYLSNYCDNQCLYCGFNAANKIERKQLSLDQVEKEAEKIAQTGLRHILILTGDSRKNTPLSYIKECLKILNKYFSSISIEIYSLKGNEYRELVSLGVDGITLYQEVYDRKIYEKMHRRGPKKDYDQRIMAVEEAAASGIRTINIGALLGLSDYRKEAFMMLLHAQYLQNKYPEAEVSVSVPRLRPQIKNFTAFTAVNDAAVVHIILAARIFMPRLGITLSTRENQDLRDNLIPLGITKISAGSTTAVGGHSLADPYDKNCSQFEIADKRDVHEMKKAILAKGYQPVFKDWPGYERV